MEENKTKKKRKKIDKSRLAIKIVAAVLALTFVVSMFTTAIYYIIANYS